MTIRSILVVEDDAILGHDLVGTLADAGYEVLGPLTTSMAAGVAAEHATPDLALVDINLIDSRLGGVEAARKLRERGTPCLFLSGDVVEARRNWVFANGFLRKPFTTEALLASVAFIDALQFGKVLPKKPNELELFDGAARGLSFRTLVDPAAPNGEPAKRT